MPSAMSCVKPPIALSGVRSSWLIVARNSLLARLADSAWARARSASARAHSSAASAALRSVISRRTTTVPSAANGVAAPSARSAQAYERQAHVHGHASSAWGTEHHIGLRNDRVAAEDLFQTLLERQAVFVGHGVGDFAERMTNRAGRGPAR